MRFSRLMVPLGMAGLLTGCIARPGTLDRSLAPGAQWTVTLVPTATSTLQGTVTFVRTEPATQTRAVFALSGGPANAVLPWHVHYGVCGNDHLIVGKPANYPPLVLSSGGNLTAVAQMPIELENRVDYDIHIHESAVDMKTIACGALVPLGTVATVTVPAASPVR
jgi:hypothetical protein